MRHHVIHEAPAALVVKIVKSLLNAAYSIRRNNSGRLRFDVLHNVLYEQLDIAACSFCVGTLKPAGNPIPESCSVERVAEYNRQTGGKFDGKQSPQFTVCDTDFFRRINQPS